MSTDTDGVPPSVAPGSEDDAGAAETVESGAAWLQAEIQRRMAVARGGAGGRHARHGGPEPAQTRPDYRARHASDPAGGSHPSGGSSWSADADPAAATEPAAPGFTGGAGAGADPSRGSSWGAATEPAAAARNADAGTDRAVAGPAAVPPSDDTDARRPAARGGTDAATATWSRGAATEPAAAGPPSAGTDPATTAWSPGAGMWTRPPPAQPPTPSGAGSSTADVVPLPARPAPTPAQPAAPAGDAPEPGRDGPMGSALGTVIPLRPSTPDPAGSQAVPAPSVEPGVEDDHERSGGGGARDAARAPSEESANGAVGEPPGAEAGIGPSNAVEPDGAAADADGSAPTAAVPVHDEPGGETGAAEAAPTSAEQTVPKPVPSTWSGLGRAGGPRTAGAGIGGIGGPSLPDLPVRRPRKPAAPLAPPRGPSAPATDAPQDGTSSPAGAPSDATADAAQDGPSDSASGAAQAGTWGAAGAPGGAASDAAAGAAQAGAWSPADGAPGTAADPRDGATSSPAAEGRQDGSAGPAAEAAGPTSPEAGGAPAGVGFRGAAHANGAPNAEGELWRPPRPGDPPSAIRPLRPFPPSGDAVARLLAAPAAAPPATPPTEAIPTVPGMPARTPAPPQQSDDRPGYGRYDYAGTYGPGRGYRRDAYDDYDDAEDGGAEGYLRPLGSPQTHDDYDDYDDDTTDDDREDGVIWRAATPPAPVARPASPAPAAAPGSAPGPHVAAPSAGNALAPHPSGAAAADPSGTPPPSAPTEAPRPAAPGKRVRVVLAERKAAARPVRTVVDLQGDSPVGEALRTGLIVDQMRVALRFALLGGLTLGVLPLLFYVVPELGTFSILGLRLPWLVLGILVYPFLCGLGWWFTRTAERVEQDFADHIQDN